MRLVLKRWSGLILTTQGPWPLPKGRGQARLHVDMAVAVRRDWTGAIFEFTEQKDLYSRPGGQTTWTLKAVVTSKTKSVYLM